VPPESQQVAMSFGGSLAFESRTGISRFGMGMKTAGLSIAPAFDNYTWQEPRAYYSVSLDVNEMGKDKSNMLEVPEPQLNDDLPSDIVDILTRPTAWPKNPPGEPDAAGDEPGRAARKARHIGHNRLPARVRPAELQEGADAGRTCSEGNGAGVPSIHRGGQEAVRE
jgi:hypothetical protein